MEACYAMKAELFFFQKRAMVVYYFPEQEVRVFPACLEKGFSKQMII